MSNITGLPRRSVLRRFAFGLITVLLSLGVSLTAAELILKYQRRQVEQSDRLASGMMLFDPWLGWRLSPNWYGDHRHHDFEVSYRINQFGFRGDFSQPDGARRYAVVGDSFTFAQGVNDNRTFVYLLNEAGGDRYGFLNFGVPGYSTDQEYLLIRERVRLFEPDVVLLVVYLGNDLFDNELGFPLQGEHAKPYFRLVDGRLVPGNSPVPRQRKSAAARDTSLSAVVMGNTGREQATFFDRIAELELSRRMGLSRPIPRIPEEDFRTRFDPALRLFTALVGEISDRVEGYGAELKLVLLPGRSYLAQPDSVSAQYQDYLRRRIVGNSAIASSGQVIDLAARLREMHESGAAPWYFPNEGHLTTEGNGVVAGILATVLGIDPGG